jgi:uncharacterized protein (UPF0333 family)
MSFDKKSKFLFLLLAILTALSIVSLFYKSYVLQDFKILNQESLNI